MGKRFLISSCGRSGSKYVAEGAAYIYPRLGLTSEWGTAAAHAVVNSAGGKVLDINTGQELKYNTKESVLNQSFIVSSK